MSVEHDFLCLQNVLAAWPGWNTRSD